MSAETREAFYILPVALPVLYVAHQAGDESGSRGATRITKSCKPDAPQDISISNLNNSVNYYWHKYGQIELADAALACMR